MVYTFHPSTQEAKAGGSEFEASLDYREFQNCQSYAEKPCFKQTKSKKAQVVLNNF